MPITPVKDMVAAAKARITSLSVEDTQTALTEGRAIIVDIRDVRELKREGRFPGAIHAPRGMLEFWVDPASPYHNTAFDTDKTLVLACAASWRSALAADTLQQMGLENVAELEGGFAAWRDAGAPVETD